MIINQRTPSGSIFRFGYQCDNRAVINMIIAACLLYLSRGSFGTSVGFRRYHIDNRALQRRMLLFNRGLGQGQPVEGVLNPHVAARVIPAAAGYDAGLFQFLCRPSTRWVISSL